MKCNSAIYCNYNGKITSAVSHSLILCLIFHDSAFKHTILYTRRLKKNTRFIIFIIKTEMFLCPDRSKSLIDSNAQFIPLTFSVKGIELHLLNKIEQSFLTVLRKRERKREHLQVLYILAYINNVLLCDPPVTTLLTERKKN